MSILGIDPGTSIVGFSVLENGILKDYGVIEPSKELSASQKLREIYFSIENIIKKYKPKELAIESLFFNKNMKTAVSVSEARGVILLLAEVNGLNIKNYTPLQVKQSVAMNGRATKKDVQYMVKLLLELEEIPQPDDAADAIAIALAHQNFLENSEIIYEDS